MNTRQEKLLSLIVSEYVKTARPVGSNLLDKELNCSPATVRSEMAILEEEGYLEKTHISSGRIPSEKGYRYYVDNLMKPKEMTGEDVLKLQTVFHNKSLDISDVILKSLEIVSELTNYTTLSLGHNSHENALKQVEVIPISNDSIVAIIITDKGYVEHKNIEIKNTSLGEVKKVVELINKLIVGTPIDEVNAKLEYELKPIIGSYVKQYQMIYDAFYNAFNDFQGKSNTHFSGKNNFLKQPEFSNVDKVRSIFEKLDDDTVLSKIEEESDEIKVYIGEESNIDTDVTVIKTKYKIGNKEGTIAIVGPKRMDYDRVVYLLDYIKSNIERS